MAKARQKAQAVHFAFRAVGALFLAFTSSCGPEPDTGDTQITRYQLCPKSSDARTRLIEITKAYAAEQQAQVFDRGAEAQSELAGMASGSGTLRSTNLPLVLLTIEKPEVFRISITNAALSEKFGLSMRFWKKGGKESNAEAFLDKVKRFWTVERIEGGVSNDPPCSAP